MMSETIQAPCLVCDSLEHDTDYCPVWHDFQVSEVEMHIGAHVDFVPKFGRKVKAAGGRYTLCRGHRSKRFVTVPVQQHKLIDLLLTRCKPGTVILRAKRGDTNRVIYHQKWTGTWDLASLLEAYAHWLRGTWLEKARSRYRTQLREERDALVAERGKMLREMLEDDAGYKALQAVLEEHGFQLSIARKWK